MNSPFGNSLTQWAQPTIRGVGTSAMRTRAHTHTCASKELVDLLSCKQSTLDPSAINPKLLQMLNSH